MATRDNRRIKFCCEELPKTRAVAAQQSAKYYFTGKECKNGHLSPRSASNGTCVECGRANAGRWAANNKDKVKEKNRLFYARNKDKEISRSAKWSKANKEKTRHNKRIWLLANHDRVIETSKAWRARNREKDREWSRTWAANNREKVRDRTRIWKKENPDKVLAMCHARRARKNNAYGTYSTEDILNIKKAQKGKCACCATSIKSSFHIDHIVAISRGGSNESRNIQLLCAACNLSKHARDPIEFMQSRGKLL